MLCQSYIQRIRLTVTIGHLNYVLLCLQEFKRGFSETLMALKIHHIPVNNTIICVKMKIEHSFAPIVASDWNTVCQRVYTNEGIQLMYRVVGYQTKRGTWQALFNNLRNLKLVTYPKTR